MRAHENAGLTNRISVAADSKGEPNCWGSNPRFQSANREIALRSKQEVDSTNPLAAKR
jgi:hypothetical protein